MGADYVLGFHEWLKLPVKRLQTQHNICGRSLSLLLEFELLTLEYRDRKHRAENTRMSVWEKEVCCVICRVKTDSPQSPRANMSSQTPVSVSDR